MSCCKKCGRELTSDEIAIYKRTVSRGAVEFLCIDCLAEHFECDKSLLIERIAYFKKMGCTLFCKD